MPVYEYACLGCKERFELIRPSAERDEPCRCPECGALKKHLRALSLFSGLSQSSSTGTCSPGSSSGFG